MREDKKRIILYVSSKSITAYDGNVIFKEDWDLKIIRDFDVLDKSTFDGFIDVFIKKANLTGGVVSLILANDVCITHDIQGTDEVGFDQKIDTFLDAVPYNQILFKNYRTRDGIRVVATNKETISGIAEVFEKEGFAVETVTPAMMFEGYIPQRGMDESFAKVVSSNYSATLSGSMVSKISAQPAETAKHLETKQQNKALPYMLAVFGVLLVVLVALILIRK